MQTAPAEILIREALRRQAPQWPAGSATGLEAALLDSAERHGVCALLHVSGLPESWPQAVRSALHERFAAAAVQEFSRHRVLAQTLRELTVADVRPIIFKGAALAHCAYPDPALRTRSDTDMLVAPSMKERAESVLSRLGYRLEVAVEGDMVNHQSNWVLRDTLGLGHAIDLHWKLSNSPVLAKLLPFEELEQACEPLDAFAPHARTPNRPTALVIACMHRATHKYVPYYVAGQRLTEGNRLIWLYDMHVLAQVLNANEWDAAVNLAQRKGLAAVCLDALLACRDAFDTILPATVVSALAQAADELPALYIEAGSLERMWMDWNASGSIRGRWRYFVQLVFPSRDYMRHKYRAYPDTSLMMLYARRSATGLLKKLSPRRFAK